MRELNIEQVPCERKNRGNGLYKTRMMCERWSMYIAMNRFQIATGFESAFEEMWRNRESYLDQVPGFKEFHLLKGTKEETHTPYLSHSVWASRQSFVDWTESEAFRKAHSQARSPEGMHLTHPRFEGFEVVL